MNYENKYKESLEKARKLYGKSCINNVLESLFPELKENEDELTWLTRFIQEEAYSLSMDIRDAEDHIKLKNLQRSLAWLEKQGEQKEYTFKSLPRLLDMVEPTERAKAYCQKLIDSLVKEGYSTDAKIVGEYLKIMNGDNVPMAIMDEKQGKPKWSAEDEKNRNALIYLVKEVKSQPLTRLEDWDGYIDWLKRLKKRMEEQQ